MSAQTVDTSSSRSPRKSRRSPLILAFAVLTLVSAAFWKVQTTRRPPTVSALDYPMGVWPTRVQSFADRMVEVRTGSAGIVRLFFIDSKTRQYVPLSAPQIEGEAVSVNGDASSFTLTPDPEWKRGDGSISFVGKIPLERVQMDRWGLFGVRATIPYNGVNHSVRWLPEQTSGWVDTRHLRQSGDAVMPNAPTSEEERKLFLIPGGKYTAADIAANGNAIASVRYRGFLAAHSMKPPKGAIICPITNTLANPKFTWIIDGKTYRFCCPPCIAEFVKQAKEKPKDIHPPAYYAAR